HRPADCPGAQGGQTPVIQATFVLLAACLVARATKQRSSAERHLLWAAALGASAVLPPIGVLLDIWQPAWARTVADLLPALVRPTTASLSRSGADVVIRANELAGSGVTLARTGGLIWIVGSMVAFAALLRGSWRLARLGKRARLVACESWQPLLVQ